MVYPVFFSQERKISCRCIGVNGICGIVLREYEFAVYRSKIEKFKLLQKIHSLAAYVDSVFAFVFCCIQIYSLAFGVIQTATNVNCTSVKMDAVPG